MTVARRVGAGGRLAIATRLHRWLKGAPAKDGIDRIGRFGRLPHEQITPRRLLEERHRRAAVAVDVRAR